MNKLRLFFATTVLALLPSLALAQGNINTQLSLFGVDLGAATKEQLVEAARRHGAKPLTTNASAVVFDVREVGLPALNSLTVVFHRQQFVLAKYSSALPEKGPHFAWARSEDTESLRKMLKARYGEPVQVKSRMGSRSAFDTPHYSSGTEHQWTFLRGFKLSYRAESISRATELTYFDPKMVALLKADAEAQHKNEAETRARAAGSAF